MSAPATVPAANHAAANHDAANHDAALASTTRLAAALLVVTLLVVTLLFGACAGGPDENAPADGGADATVGAQRGQAPSVTSLIRSGSVEIAPYSGAHLLDQRLRELRVLLANAATSGEDLAREHLDHRYLPDRGPLVRVSDEAPAGWLGTVELRVAGTLRRPVVTIRTSSLLCGEFVPEAHLPRALVEAALAARGADRDLPPWLRVGAPLVISGTFPRALHERVLGGMQVAVTEDAVFAGAALDASDPVAAATRVAALARIATGRHPLGRFADALMRGSSPDEALGSVSIDGTEFLDAATRTQRRRVSEDLQADALIAADAAARTALADGNAGAADAALTGVATVLADPEVDRFAAADLLILRAEIALARDETAVAADYVARALAHPEHLVRLRHARWMQVQLLDPGPDRGRAAAHYLADFPDAPARAEALAEVGLTEDVLRAAPGIDRELVSAEATERMRAAARLGELGAAAGERALRLLAHDPDHRVRRGALTALAVVLGPAASADLLAATRDDDGGVRAHGLDLLARVDADAAKQRATQLRRDPDPAVRTAVARIVGSGEKRPRPPTGDEPADPPRKERRVADPATRSPSPPPKPPRPPAPPRPSPLPPPKPGPR